MTLSVDAGSEEIAARTHISEAQHARMFLVKVQGWTADFVTTRAAEALRQMDRKINNVISAAQRAGDVKLLNLPEVARDFALVLYEYYDLRGRWDDWLVLGEQALEVCDRLGDTYSCSDAYAMVCNSLGVAQRMLTNYAAARSYFERALQRAVSDLALADTLTNFADLERLAGKSDAALNAAQAARTHAQRSADPNREAICYRTENMS